MTESDPRDLNVVVDEIRALAAAQRVRITLHAPQRMVEEGISVDAILEAVGNGRIVEYYPRHRRGPCCLVAGVTEAGRHLHVVCTTARPVLIIITAYEPTPPKWATPTQRSHKP